MTNLNIEQLGLTGNRQQISIAFLYKCVIFVYYKISS